MATTAIDIVRLIVVSNDASLLRLLGAAAQSNAWHLETLGLVGMLWNECTPVKGSILHYWTFAVETTGDYTCCGGCGG